MPILLMASGRATWRLEPRASDSSSGALSLFNCLLRRWQEGRTRDPQPEASPSTNLPFVPSPGAGAARAFGEGGFPAPGLGWVTLHCVHDHVAHVDD